MKLRMHTSLATCFLLGALSGQAAAQAEPEQTLSAEEQAYLQWANDIWSSVDQKAGLIELPQAGAALNIPDSFYFLNASDAEKVLVEVWGNPPGQQVLGMIFPADTTPFDADSWAVTIAYEEEGYVSDEDASDIDYSDLLADMQADTRAANQERMAQGYGSVELVGWAAHPYYDAMKHKMHWAKELNFGGAEMNTLNYNIRVLGRRGVLVLNFIANMDQQSDIERNLDAVLAMADFQPGATYAEFNPEIDQVAAYGLGALVAGKVAAKTGFLAAALLLLKKFWFVILLAIGGLGKLLFRKKA